MDSFERLTLDASLRNASPRGQKCSSRRSYWCGSDSAGRIPRECPHDERVVIAEAAPRARRGDAKFERGPEGHRRRGNRRSRAAGARSFAHAFERDFFALARPSRANDSSSRRPRGAERPEKGKTDCAPVGWLAETLAKPRFGDTLNERQQIGLGIRQSVHGAAHASPWFPPAGLSPTRLDQAE